MLLIAIQFTKLFKSIEEDNPFTLKNTKIQAIISIQHIPISVLSHLSAARMNKAFLKLLEKGFCLYYGKKNLRKSGRKPFYLLPAL